MIIIFFFQAVDGIRDLVRSRGLGDVYKRQACRHRAVAGQLAGRVLGRREHRAQLGQPLERGVGCLLYTSEADDDLPCVDLGGRSIIKKKNTICTHHSHV